ncbi:MAG: hypothetical protein ABIR11_06590 [Candidatus Limnocylindrales bacterium]
MTMGENHAVLEFVDAYRMAFERFDASAIANLFFYPCQITSDGGEISVVSVPTRDAWLPQVERLVETYRTIGVRSAEVVTLQVVELTPRLAEAAITWRLVDEAGQRLYDFDATYTLADPGVGLRITTIAHNETPYLRAAVARSRARDREL